MNPLCALSVLSISHQFTTSPYLEPSAVISRQQGGKDLKKYFEATSCFVWDSFFCLWPSFPVHLQVFLSSLLFHFFSWFLFARWPLFIVPSVVWLHISFRAEHKVFMILFEWYFRWETFLSNNESFWWSAKHVRRQLLSTLSKLRLSICRQEQYVLQLGTEHWAVPIRRWFP